jgi:hypothetical protein
MEMAEDEKPKDDRPNPSKEKDGKSSRDWLAVTISVVSLACSGLTAFFNIVLQQDDIRIVVDRMPDMARDEKGNMFGSNGIELTILNAGNRAAVVTKMVATAYQRDGESGSRECKNPSDKVPFPITFFNDFKPVVVKPGEIQFVATRVTPMFPWNKARRDDLGEMALPKEMHGKNVQFFLMCLNMTVTAPDSPAYKWSAPMGMMKKHDVSADYLPTDLYDKEKPITVLKTRHTIFDF